MPFCTKYSWKRGIIDLIISYSEIFYKIKKEVTL